MHDVGNVFLRIYFFTVFLLKEIYEIERNV